MTATAVATRRSGDRGDRLPDPTSPAWSVIGHPAPEEIDEVADHAVLSGGVAMALVAVVAGLLGVGQFVTSAHEARSAVVAITNVAAVLLLASTLLLAARWRLAGEPRAAFSAAVTLLSTLVTMPAVVVTDGRADGSLVAVASALGPFAAAAVLVVVGSARRADLRSAVSPVRAIVLSLAGAVGLSLATGLSPLGGLLRAQPLPGLGAGSLMTAACGVAGAGWCLLRAWSSRRLVDFALAGELLAIGLSAASAALAPELSGAPAPAALPSLVLLGGALPLALATTVDLGRAIETVVAGSARGQRLRQVAESQLEDTRRTQKGLHHDLNASLSAVSAALVLLQDPRVAEDPSETRRLAIAAQEQILGLQSQLVADAGPPRWFAIGDVVERTVSIRKGQVQPVVTSIEPGLVAWGRPDHFALALNNLLANAAAYASGSPVAVQVHQVMVGDKAGVQVLVSDHGPGVRDPAKALTPGWRGTSIGRTMGSGLGLPQCKSMVEANMGRFCLYPTDPGRPIGQQGLTVEMVLRGLDDKRGPATRTGGAVASHVTSVGPR